MNGKIELPFADGDYTFNIAKIGQVLELEEKCGCGVAEVFARLMSADDLRNARWRFNDVRETVRLGLIGGGASAPDALRLVKAYVDVRPWQESIPIARTILMAAIIGVPGDDVGKKQEADQAKTESPSTPKMEDSSDPHSTALPPASGGDPEKLTSTRSGNSRPASKGTTARRVGKHRSPRRRTKNSKR